MKLSTPRNNSVLLAFKIIGFLICATVISTAVISLGGHQRPDIRTKPLTLVEMVTLGMLDPVPYEPQCEEFEPYTIFTGQKSRAAVFLRKAVKILQWEIVDDWSFTGHFLANPGAPDGSRWAMKMRRLEYKTRSGEIPRCIQAHSRAENLNGLIFPKERLLEVMGNVDFMPKTFPLIHPSQVDSFVEHLPCVNEDQAKDQWIFKKFRANMGRHMYVISDYMEIRKLLDRPLEDHCKDVYGSSWDKMNPSDIQKRYPSFDPNVYLAQKYIYNPILINAKKFHIRTHFLMASDYPLLLLHYDSLALIAALDYDSSSNDTDVHLSNTHKSMQVEKDRSKLKMQMPQFQQYLFDKGITGPTWINDTLIPRQMEIFRIIFEKIRQRIQAKHDPRILKFRLLGADFLITEDLEVSLLEIVSLPGHMCLGVSEICDYFVTWVADSLRVVDEVHQRRLKGRDFRNLDKIGRFRVIIDRSAPHMNETNVCDCCPQLPMDINDLIGAYGDEDGNCEDSPDWKDVNGNDCTHYMQNDVLCDYADSLNIAGHKSASEACCICQES